MSNLNLYPKHLIVMHPNPFTTLLLLCTIFPISLLLLHLTCCTLLHGTLCCPLRVFKQKRKIILSVDVVTLFYYSRESCGPVFLLNVKYREWALLPVGPYILYYIIYANFMGDCVKFHLA